ncbi:MAG: type II secretion system F family protein [Firmicutes bacterium]|nr:type II secretion system F family protein [Bacillota bacterium]
MVTGRDLALFTRHLYYMTRSGAPLPEVFRNLKWDVENRELKSAVGNLEEKTGKGDSLFMSMSSYPNIFPEYYRKMVQAAEDCDCLPQALGDLAGYIDEEEKAGKAARSAILYPVLILNGIFLFITMIYIFVMPALLKIMINYYGGIHIPGSDSIPWTAKLFFSPAAVILGAFVIVFANAMVFTNMKPSGAFLLNMPFSGKLIMKASLVKISRAVGFMLKQGMTLPEALRYASKITDVGVFAKALEKAAADTENGIPLSDSLKNQFVFPGTFTSLVKAGETREDLPLCLLETACVYEKELEIETIGALKLVEPALIGVMGIITGLVICAVFYPVYLIPGLIN